MPLQTKWRTKTNYFKLWPAKLCAFTPGSSPCAYLHSACTRSVPSEWKTPPLTRTSAIDGTAIGEIRGPSKFTGKRLAAAGDLRTFYLAMSIKSRELVGSKNTRNWWRPFTKCKNWVRENLVHLWKRKKLMLILILMMKLKSNCWERVKLTHQQFLLLILDSKNFRKFLMSFILIWEFSIYWVSTTESSSQMKNWITLIWTRISLIYTWNKRQDTRKGFEIILYFG